MVPNWAKLRRPQSTDAGLGRLASRGRFKDERYDDDLEAACKALIESSRPDLVPDFAERLAAARGLPYAAAVTQTRETRQQVRVENSRQQFLNVQGAFAP